MKGVVLIPAYNEEKSIGNVLDRIDPKFYKVVIDDGSTDKTSEFAKQHKALVLTHPVRRGVGEAFRTGMLYAINNSFDIIVTLDGDGQMFPEDIPYLVRPILDGEYDAVVVNRFGYKHIRPKISKAKERGNKFFAWLVSKIVGIRICDSACGFRAYSLTAAKKLGLHGKFTYTQESLIELVNSNLRVLQLPRYVAAKREQGKSKISSNLPAYGMRASSIILRNVRDRDPFFFFGVPSTLFLACGIIILLYVLVRKIFFGMSILENYPWFFVGSLGLIFLGFLLLIFALLADMIKRTQEDFERIFVR